MYIYKLYVNTFQYNTEYYNNVIDYLIVKIQIFIFWIYIYQIVKVLYLYEVYYDNYSRMNDLCGDRL